LLHSVTYYCSNPVKRNICYRTYCVYVAATTGIIATAVAIAAVATAVAIATITTATVATATVAGYAAAAA
jgi:hypothetical protein